MQEITLQPDSHDSSKSGPIPWALGLLTLAALAFLMSQQLQNIQNDVTNGVRAVMAASNVGKINVDVDGRDVTLNGTISSDVDRDWFVQSVEALDSVRVVRDEMVEHDPRKQAQIERLQFQQAVDKISTSSISFEPGSADFAPGSETALEELVVLLRKHSNRRIKVAGHTDASGRRDLNLALSRDRAQAVTRYLEDRGVSGIQLLSQGYGSTQPVDSNETESGRANNRRIELTVMN